MHPIARKFDLTIEKLPDEVIVYDHIDNRAHCLNQTVHAVWELCDGSNSVDDIVAALWPELDEPQSRALVELSLEQLSKRSLLVDPVKRPGYTRLVERRRFLRQMVGAVVALPIILTLTAPDASAQSTVFPPLDGGECVTAADCAPIPLGPCSTFTFSTCDSGFCGGATTETMPDGTACGAGMVCEAGACVAAPPPDPDSDPDPDPDPGPG